jgi:CheY-like chemotaxis protein
MPPESNRTDHFYTTNANSGSAAIPDDQTDHYEYRWAAAGQVTGLQLTDLGVRIDTRAGEGTSVKVHLPRAANAEITDVTRGLSEAGRAHHRSAIILLVDDDSAVREVTASILRELGYSVLETGSGGAALDVLDREARIDLVLIDFAMPGMNRVEVARQAQSKSPGLPVLFVTGYADTAALGEIGVERVIKNPYVGDELANKVRVALANVGARSTRKVVPLRG